MRTALLKPFDLFLLLLCFFLIANCSERKAPPKAVKGVLDLRDWDFDSSQDSGSDGIVKLDGEWEFYWEELPARDETGVLQLPEDKKEFINVPGSWNGKKILHKRESGEREEETLEGIGYATYRLEIFLKKGGNMALRISSGTAFSLYADNQLLAHTGKVGKTVEESMPKRQTQVVSLDLPPDTKELTLILAISNFHYSRGGFHYSIQMGKESEVLNLRESSLLLDIFVFGILFIMGIYHLSLYSLHREDRSALYFGFLCLLISLRTLFTGEIYLHTIFPNLRYSLSMKLEYLTLYLSIPMFSEFLHSLYPEEGNQRIRTFILYFQLFFSFLVIFLPPIYFTISLNVVQINLLLCIVYVIYILIKAFRKGKKGVRTFLLGFFVFASIIINDILYSKQIINTGYYSSIGLVAFIFSQAILLSSRFANAFHQVKDLSLNLEKKVEERTRDLEAKNAQIEAAYVELQTTQSQLIEAERMASLGQLVGGIAHEINNPIAVIHSHAELLEANQNSTLKEIPLFLNSLETKEINLFYEIVDISIKNRIFLNSKEERKQRKEVQKELLEIVKDESLCITLSDSLVQLRLPPPYEKYIEELGAEKLSKFLTMAEVFKNQSNSLSSIEIALEKASRVVFALRSYLNTELSSSRKEVDLVKELDKALHVYDNYVMGKINIRQDFPRELRYTCVAENIAQVWKNLFFNAIQAMYTTDKKLELRLEQVEKLPESLKSFKSSSIVEESLFQKDSAKGWILVSITDSGTGISPELADKVFTPFFTTKSLGEGIGLGLYTCKKIVHEHRGALFFRSGEGSTEFVVALPS